jgi:hypothetical protein
VYQKTRGTLVVTVVLSSENKTVISLGDNLKYNGWFSSSMFMVYHKVDQNGRHLVTAVRMDIPCLPFQIVAVKQDWAETCGHPGQVG